MKRSTKAILIPLELPTLRILSMEYGSTEPVSHQIERDPYKQPINRNQWRRALNILQENVTPEIRQRYAMLALGIREGLLWADDIMNRYCAITCDECHSPCCNANGIYYDRADLLYLLALDADLPAGQTREKSGDACRYLTPEGCLLPRMCRPFICTWYLCEPQMTFFQSEPTRFQREFTAIMQTIRRCRLQINALHDQRPQLVNNAG